MGGLRRTGGRADGGGWEADRRTAAGERVDGRRMSGREADEWTGGRRADRRTWGKREADGRKGGGWADGRTIWRMEADGRTSGQADESGRGTDRAD